MTDKKPSISHARVAEIAAKLKSPPKSPSEMVDLTQAILEGRYNVRKTGKRTPEGKKPENSNQTPSNDIISPARPVITDVPDYMKENEQELTGSKAFGAILSNNSNINIAVEKLVMIINLLRYNNQSEQSTTKIGDEENMKKILESVFSRELTGRDISATQLIQDTNQPKKTIFYTICNDHSSAKEVLEKYAFLSTILSSFPELSDYTHTSVYQAILEWKKSGTNLPDNMTIPVFDPTIPNRLWGGRRFKGSQPASEPTESSRNKTTQKERQGVNIMEKIIEEEIKNFLNELEVVLRSNDETNIGIMAKMLDKRCDNLGSKLAKFYKENPDTQHNILSLIANYMGQDQNTTEFKRQMKDLYRYMTA